MIKSYKGHKFILCVIYEVINYLITVPICQSKSEEVSDALIENIITKYCIPEYIICGSRQWVHLCLHLWIICLRK